uniref:Uncharacterized protein n=1 Tax=Setaria italica TaxID=4555 RepID=K3ZF64_SETIT
MAKEKPQAPTRKIVKENVERKELKKLWSVVQTLMSNQTKLQQQYDELKSQVSAPQIRCPSVESSPKDEMQGIKCGMGVGLASPNSKKMVAMGTIQRTDSKAKGSDGHPLADCVEIMKPKLNNVHGASQTVTKSKSARKMTKEKT